ncbi:MAG: hypothetical protein V1821_00980 [bacterium]
MNKPRRPFNIGRDEDEEHRRRTSRAPEAALQFCLVLLMEVNRRPKSVTSEEFYRNAAKDRKLIKQIADLMMSREFI